MFHLCLYDNLKKHLPGVLDVLLHLDEELNSLPAIKQSVVVGESQVHHRANLDLSVDSDGALLDSMETQNCALGKVDDRSTHQGAEDAAVADGESAASHVLNGELTIASLQVTVSTATLAIQMRGNSYLLAHIGDRLLNANEIHGLNITDYGSDKTLLGGHSDTDVDIVAIDNGVTAVGTLNGGVNGRDVTHGQDTGAGESTHEAELDTSLLEDLVLVLLAEIHQGRHVNLVESGKRGSSVLGLLETLGDAEAHAVHLDLLDVSV